MKMRKVALAFRGLCETTVYDSKNLLSYNISYTNTIDNIIKNLIDCNEDYLFDIYGFGWADDHQHVDKIKKTFENIDNVDKIDIQLDKKIDFYEEYKNIKNYKEKLKHIYKFRHPNHKYFDDIKLHDLFQNSYSFAYSISKSHNMIKDTDYEYYISLRWDLIFKQNILLNDLNLLEDKIIINNQPNHSPIFVGDFFLLSKYNILEGFYDYFNNIFTKDDSSLLHWYGNELKNQDKYSNSRYTLSCFTNQALYAHYLYIYGYDYFKIFHIIDCVIVKEKVLG